MFTKNEEQILSWCKQLACSQGFYGRLLEELMENRELLQELASKNFSDMLDFILFIEG